MLYYSVEDFYEKAGQCCVLTRQEEIECAEKMKLGDESARQRLIESYLPTVAGYIRHMSPNLRTLGMVLYCVQALERSVDSFNFLQEGEPFTHRLSWAIRQAAVRYIVR